MLSAATPSPLDSGPPTAGLTGDGAAEGLSEPDWRSTELDWVKDALAENWPEWVWRAEVPRWPEPRRKEFIYRIREDVV